MDSEELTKVTLNLNKKDVEFFKKRFGYGWSTEIRRIVEREVRNYNWRDQDNRQGIGRL